MGNTLDHHLRDGKSESLARAKATLKDRLRQKMMQEALDELQDTQRVVDEAMEAFAVRKEALKEAKDAFKQRLLDDIRQQAIEEIAADIDGMSLEVNADVEVLSEAREAFKQRLFDQVCQQAVDEVGAEVGQQGHEAHAENKDLAKARDAFKQRLRDHVLRQAVDEVGAEADDASDALFERAKGDILSKAKDAFKQRLLDHVLQQAIAEIDAEVDLDVEEGMDAAEEHTALTLALNENVEELFDSLGKPEEIQDEPVVGVHFWEDENTPIEEIPDPSVEVSLSEEERQEEEDHGFFLSDPNGPGSDSAAVSSGEQVEEAFDFAGDGAWQSTEQVGVFDADEAASPASVVYYVYGILSGIDVADETLPKEGIDPLFPIYCLVHHHVQALVSKVSTAEYGKEALQVNLFDPVWKEQQARMHEGFVERFSQEERFLPLPLCTIYKSEAEVQRMLSEPRFLDVLEKIQGRSQWQLKLFRNVDVLHQQLVENSAAVQQLLTDIKSNPGGGAQSIKKKMVSAIREEEAAITDNCTKDVHERLFAHADDVELGVLNGEGDRDMKELILEATYLVPGQKQEAFKEDVERLVGEYTTFGFEFAVSGPALPTLFSRIRPTEKA